MGWSALALLPRALPRSLAERLALGWLVGFIWLGWLVQLALLLLGHVPGWLWPAAAVVVPLAVLRHRRAIAVRPRPSSRLFRPTAVSWAVILLAILIGQSVYVLAASLSSGLGWDGLAVWAMKAKALYWDTVQVPGSLLAFLLSPSWAFSNPEQPLALSALETWLYLWVGGVDERAAKIVAPLCLVALLAVLSAHLTRLLDAP